MERPFDTEAVKCQRLPWNRKSKKTRECDSHYISLLLGTFSWLFVVAGTHKSLGVLYIDLLELFQQGAFATSLVAMVFTFAWCLTCM